MLDSESLPGGHVAGNLMQAIKTKCTASEAVELLRSCPNPSAGSMGTVYASPLSTVNCILFMVLKHL